MARGCGCASLDTCACQIRGEGSVEVKGSGGNSDPYRVLGPVLRVQDNSSFDLTVTGAGTSASPWTVSVKLRVYTTAGRPTAATATDGQPIYDTTLNKPLWSDGTVWRDAAGTAV